jgi:lysophospholipase L1-like esterase
MVVPPTPAHAAGAWVKPATASLVGDSLTAERQQVYRDALSFNGVVPSAVSGVSSRALRYGWQCWVNGSLRIYPSPVNTGCKREGLEELKHWAAQGTLGDAVVIALGTNDAGLYSSSRQMENFAQARSLIGARPMYLVTVISRSSAQNQKMIAFNNTARAWCAADAACAVIDWASTPQAQNRGIYTDSVHLTPTGTLQRASFIAEQVVALSVRVDTSPLPSTSTVGSPVSFTALTTPVRLADSRIPLGLTRIAAGTQQRLQVAGVGGIADTATAAAVNLTITGAEAAGFLTVFPCGTRPLVSAVNWPGANATVANSQIATLDSTGGLCVFALSTTHLVVDVSGFFSEESSSRYNPISPFRAADSRTAVGGVVRLAARQTVPVMVTNRNGVASNASAVAVNVTVVNPATSGFVSLFACDASPPPTSSLNFSAGEIRANNALVRVDIHGAVCVSSTSATDVVLDVSGWFGATGKQFQAVRPLRLLDTRSNHLVLSGGRITAPVPASGVVTVDVAGVRGIPAGASAAALNVTVVTPPRHGFVTAFPDGADPRQVSTLNHEELSIIANGAQVPLRSSRFGLFTLAGGHLVADLSGVWL